MQICKENIVLNKTGAALRLRSIQADLRVYP